MARRHSNFGKDGGLQARMLLTMFLLGLVYVVFVGVLFAAGAGAGTAGTAFTGNKEIVLPAESAVPFTLKAPLKIRR